MNRTGLLHECTEWFGKSITRGWANFFITRHAHELVETKVFRKKIRGLKCLEFFLKRRSMDSETMFTMHALNLCLTETKLAWANGKITVSDGSRSVDYERTNDLPRCPQEFETYIHCGVHSSRRWTREPIFGSLAGDCRRREKA
jgi:hypothetical protein